VIALPCMLYSMDLTVLNLAVPHLSADLQPSASQLLWIVDIYGSWSPACSSPWGRWATGSAAAACC
jgi:DHA2 family multidrug resistance protein-like MFS transporter